MWVSGLVVVVDCREVFWCGVVLALLFVALPKEKKKKKSFADGVGRSVETSD